MPAAMPRSVMHARAPDKGAASLHSRTDVDRERLGRLEGLDDRAEINRLRIIRSIFRDFRPVQHLEPVALEHPFAPPVLERRDLAVNMFLTLAVKVTQIR